MPKHIIAFELLEEEVQDDGSLAQKPASVPLRNGRLFAKPDAPGIPDGIKVSHRSSSGVKT